MTLLLVPQNHIHFLADCGGQVTHILLVVDRSTPPDHEDIAAYELPVVDAYYESDTEMELLYDRTNRTISFEVGTEKTVLKPVEYHSELPHTRLGGWTRYFTDLAYAQSAPNLREISKDLQSTDPILRLEARARLAEMGQRSIPYIQEVLTDKKSPYFAKLGAISALNK